MKSEVAGCRSWLIVLACGLGAGPSHAADARLRSVLYSNDEVYRLRGYAGYQIDLEFDGGESFVGLGSGDVEALAFEAQGNHLFIKPKAMNVRTNLTVLTTRRTYHFEYVAGSQRSDADSREMVYALRFQYPKSAMPPDATALSVNTALEHRSDSQVHNADYWFCGSDQLQPLRAWDDGVHTHLQFNPRIEMPAVFVRNDDTSESLLNFSIDGNEVVIHRVARQFIVRRGKLVGCIVNHGFSGIGDALESGTVSPTVQRATRPVAVPP
jgi:type IV secretion system protein VirB9